MAEFKGPTTVGGNEVLRYRYSDFKVNPAANSTSGAGAVVTSNATYDYSFGYISEGQTWFDTSWNPYAPPAMQGVSYGYVAGGFTTNTTYSFIVQKYDLASGADATPVGSLTTSISYLTGTSSDTHGYTIGGVNYPALYLTARYKFPFSSDTNASSVPNFSPVGKGYLAGVSSPTSGYAIGGYTGSVRSNEIRRFPFSSDSTLVAVGVLATGVNGLTGIASDTYGYGTGGYSGTLPQTTAIRKFPFSSDTPATDIGDLTWGSTGAAGNSSDTTGYTLGGTHPTAPYAPGYIRSISSFPFSSDTNGTQVGTLESAQSGYAMTGTNSTTEGFSSGGPSPTNNLSIFKFPFAGPSSTSNSLRDLATGVGYAAGAQV